MVLVAGCILPVSAKTTVIRQLGTAPLLGPSSSTAIMRQRVEQNQSILRQAALNSGLTAAQFEQLNQAIAASRVQWVTVPRRLTVMTWRSGQRVYVIRDVKIPPGVHGWEVDLKDRRATVAVYLPAACGNLSYVRRAQPIVAVLPRRVKPKTLALAVAPALTPAETPSAAPVAPVPEVAVLPGAAPPAAPPAAALASAVGSVHSPIGEIAALAGVIAGGIALVGGGGGGGGAAGSCP
ncbi:MAG: hypothetical protein ABSH03_20930 [Candidatus Lustribacter sp.]